MPVPSVSTTRFRERGHEAPITQITEDMLNVPTGVHTQNFRGDIRLMGRELSMMTDAVTPGFKILQSEGNVFFKALSQITQSNSGSSTGGQIKTKTPQYVYTCDGPWPQYMLRSSDVRKSIDADGNIHAVLSGLSSSQRERTIAVAKTQAAGIPSDAQLLVAMAEFMKTVRLLPDILNGFSQMLTKVNTWYAEGRRRAVWRNVKDELDFLQNLWLQFRFGVRPLVVDSVGMIKAVKRIRSNDLMRITQRGGAHIDASASSTGTLSYGVTRTPITESTSDMYSVRAMTLWSAKVGMLDDLGIKLANVPLALVDLTRFSFVLNWIVNVNDFAAAIGAVLQPGWSRLGGCYVERRETSTVYATTGSTVVSPGFTSTYVPTRDFEGNFWAIQRSVIRVPGAPLPTFTLRGDPLAWARDARLVDAVTLLRQVTRGKGVRALSSFRL